METEQLQENFNVNESMKFLTSFVWLFLWIKYNNHKNYWAFLFDELYKVTQYPLKIIASYGPERLMYEKKNE